LPDQSSHFVQDSYLHQSTTHAVDELKVKPVNEDSHLDHSSTNGWTIAEAVGGRSYQRNVSEEDPALLQGREGGAASPLSFDTWSHLTGDEDHPRDFVETTPSIATPPLPTSSTLGEWQQVRGSWKVKS